MVKSVLIPTPTSYEFGGHSTMALSHRNLLIFSLNFCFKETLVTHQTENEKARSWRVVLGSRILTVLGGWLVLSSLFMDFQGVQGPAANNMFMGIVIIVLSVLVALNPLRSFPLSIICVLVGIWLFIAAFAAGYPSPELWNNIYVGSLTVLFAAFVTSESLGIK